MLLKVVDDGAVVDPEGVGVDAKLTQGDAQRLSITLNQLDQVVVADEGVASGEKEDGKVSGDPRIRHILARDEGGPLGWGVGVTRWKL